MSVEVPAGRAEAARAWMIELFPQGFEEIDRPHGIELVAYTDAGGEERMWHVFGKATATDVANGWEDRWREFHRPVRVGGVWIGPPWHERPATGPSVVIDPGRAFGTGAHPTTRLALELLIPLPHGSLLEVGCGSGVLSIAAARLGFRPVRAIDVDESAVAATRANAALNGVDITAEQGDGLTAVLPNAEVAVANITRDIVEALAPRLDGRFFVASGYLMSDEAELPGYVHRRRASSDGWAADLYERQ